MISEVKQAIVNKLLELYSTANGYTIYDEDIPQNFKRPSFLVTVIEQSYDKRLHNTYKSTVSFDLAYFSDKNKNDVKSDCQEVQVNLLRGFDIISTYKIVVEEPEEPEEPEEEPEETLVPDKNFRVLNKNAQIIDNVLHLTFDVNYSESKVEESTEMQEQTTTTNL
jgi:hypothetical protein